MQNLKGMKKKTLLAIGLVVWLTGLAQQKEGRVIYERAVQMQFQISDQAGSHNEMQRTRTDRLELNFANDKMSIRQLEDEIEDENAGGGGGVMIRTIGGGADDVTYCDFRESRRVEAREFFDKKYIITDSIRRNNWKLSDETRTILNYICRKATSQRISQRMTMTMDNGKMERREIPDTSTIVAWFTTDIPVPAGPEVQGQLPGLILELETNNGRTVYRAQEIFAKADLKSIKEPVKGKKLSPEEFAKERNKMLEEMQKNNQGGNFRIRMN